MCYKLVEIWDHAFAKAYQYLFSYSIMVLLISQLDVFILGVVVLVCRYYFCKKNGYARESKTNDTAITRKAVAS